MGNNAVTGEVHRFNWLGTFRRINGYQEAKIMDVKPEKKFRVETIVEGKLKTSYFPTYDRAEAHYLLEVQCGNPTSVAEYLITPHNKWRIIKEEPQKAWEAFRKKAKK
jgi:hypothetical protein